MKTYEEILKEEIEKIENDLGLKLDPKIGRNMIKRDAKFYNEFARAVEDAIEAFKIEESGSPND